MATCCLHNAHPARHIRACPYAIPTKWWPPRRPYATRSHQRSTSLTSVSSHTRLCHNYEANSKIPSFLMPIAGYCTLLCAAGASNCFALLVPQTALCGFVVLNFSVRICCAQAHQDLSDIYVFPTEAMKGTRGTRRLRLNKTHLWYMYTWHF